MKVFEFHFNPPIQSEVIAGQAKNIFDSFCYEPENIYEKRLGSLYIVGLLKNPLPQNAKLLDRLSQVIKETHYTLSFNKMPEKSLIESLKRANEFLVEQVKKENVSWLGNLSLAILNLIPYQKPWWQFGLSFTKVGEIQIFLTRKNQIIDIGSQLESQELEPYPLKIFFNIASGKLAEGDLILVLTKEISDFFAKPTNFFQEKSEKIEQNLFEKIANLSPFDEEKLRKIFKDYEAQLSKISGICLLIALVKETVSLKREVILPPEKEFSLKEVLTLSLKNLALVLRPIINPAKALFQKISQTLASQKRDIKKISPLPKIKIIKTWRFNIIRSEKFKENLIIVLLLIFFLIFGTFIFQKEEKQKLQQYQDQLNQLQEKVNQVESLLITDKMSPEIEQKVNLLLKESWQDILSLIKKNTSLPSHLSKQSLDLKDEIEKKLFQINKLEKIEQPQLFFEFKSKEFIPQKIILFKKDLYFFSPLSQNLFKITQDTKEKTILPITNKFNFGATLPNSILFFSKPDQLTILKNGEIFTQLLEKPHPDFSFDALSVFNKNLYFLDKKMGQIIKYPYIKDFQWGKAQIWLRTNAKKTTELKSITVDGQVWILKADNTIDRYHLRNPQETIKLDIFPFPKRFSKILTSRDFLFILEPGQNRIIIIDKSGKILKQFQSDQFNNLLDFAFSDKDKTIWVLNGLKLYQIPLSY